ncbi:protein SAWADEE HOMEODOMAIN HOMOLOG 1 isoform X2 [Ricinus communis]|uniref:protein SAWADEE HOMEODOMAIN HOMOLOG 1 isoform X2 n=1 Tax=Ricinus communis TaxID=3988 RepID=UPI00201AE056|nr:protein SAWADEE HOMEODOMAIN HOMOLOG 1 isoform X2 [Ricinus communis]
MLCLLLDKFKNCASDFQQFVSKFFFWISTFVPFAFGELVGLFLFVPETWINIALSCPSGLLNGYSLNLCCNMFQTSMRLYHFQTSMQISCNKIFSKVTDLSELIFEARSSRDNAWYDVAAFLNYRVLSTGELEARVRFSGFRNTDDEWVNVKRAVRERSIPLEPSECHRVKVGDLVLCFRERFDQAVYCDAHVVGIQRRPHEAASCRCIFVVRYDHDNTEEAAQLERLCCRPTQ